MTDKVVAEGDRLHILLSHLVDILERNYWEQDSVIVFQLNLKRYKFVLIDSTTSNLSQSLILLFWPSKYTTKNLISISLNGYTNFKKYCYID